MLDYSKLGEGYSDTVSMMRDYGALFDLLLYYYYLCHNWLGPDSKLRSMLGVIISREEFERNIEKSRPLSVLSRLSAEELETYNLSSELIGARISNTTAKIPALELFGRFELNEFERLCALLAYMAELDSKYAKLFGYLRDDITQKYPDIQLAVLLFMPADGEYEEYRARFRKNRLFISLFEPEELKNNTLKLRAAAIEYISLGELSDAPGLELFDGETAPREASITGEATAARLKSIAEAFKDGENYINISGAPGCGKRHQIRRLMREIGGRCLFADLAEEGTDIENAALTARIAGAYLCLYGFERERVIGENGERESCLSFSGSALRGARPYMPLTFLLTIEPLRAETELAASVSIAPLTGAERLCLFEAFFGGLSPGKDVSLGEIAETFSFEPKQIIGAANAAGAYSRIGGKLDSAAVHRLCYAQVTHSLSRLATRLRPMLTWDDIVLPKAQLSLLKQACSHIQYSHTVLTQWGFGQRLGYGTGLAVLFSGVPGTGKTMCAQIIAGYLNMELYRINISKIVSKYIGETEKNLAAVFREAKKTGAILFFDECDAIFGKRSEVKDAHDRNANVEVAYLLQQIEEHSGMVIMATNLSQNIDAAFLRRIAYSINFPFPDKKAREEIFRRTIPKSAPLGEDIDFAYLSEKFAFSGGHIKNIVLSAAFHAAGEGQPIKMRHMLIAAIRETRKSEIVVVREHFRDYDDYIAEEFGE